MTKVVYNACYGGFSLSKEAVQRYWEIKGKQIWIEDDKEQGFVTWDSHNKFEYKFEYKVGGVNDLGAWTYVMPGVLLQNVSWD